MVRYALVASTATTTVPCVTWPFEPSRHGYAEDPPLHAAVGGTDCNQTSAALVGSAAASLPDRLGPASGGP